MNFMGFGFGSETTGVVMLYKYGGLWAGITLRMVESACGPVNQWH